MLTTKPHVPRHALLTITTPTSCSHPNHSNESNNVSSSSSPPVPSPPATYGSTSKTSTCTKWYAWNVRNMSDGIKRTIDPYTGMHVDRMDVTTGVKWCLFSTLPPPTPNVLFLSSCLPGILLPGKPTLLLLAAAQEVVVIGHAQWVARMVPDKLQ